MRIKRLSIEDYWTHGQIIPCDEVDYGALFSFAKMKRGWVYIASSSNSLDIKIGRTSKTPEQRMRSLETAGVQGQFKVLQAVEFVNSPWAEKTIHNELIAHNTTKEFFQIDAFVAYSCLLKIKSAEELLLKNWPRSGLLHAPSFEALRSHANFQLPTKNLVY